MITSAIVPVHIERTVGIADIQAGMMLASTASTG